jgi:hypothetical protein
MQVRCHALQPCHVATRVVHQHRLRAIVQVVPQHQRVDTCIACGEVQRAAAQDAAG